MAYYNNNEKHLVTQQARSNSGFRLPSPATCLLSPVSCLLSPVSLLLLLLLLTGCTSLRMPQLDLSAWKPPGPVTSVAASWSPAISNGANPQRGFGGRVYFYDGEMRPVKIKGKVIVYVFEEDGRAKGDAKPNEGIVFDEKTLNSRGVYVKSSLGHSYNLWIPIDDARPESPAKKISLIVRYIPNQGTQQMSAQTTTHLPGRRADDGAESLEESHVWETHAESRVFQPSEFDPFSSSEVVPVRQERRQERSTLTNDDHRPHAMQAVTIR